MFAVGGQLAASAFRDLRLTRLSMTELCMGESGLLAIARAGDAGAGGKLTAARLCMLMWLPLPTFLAPCAEAPCDFS